MKQLIEALKTESFSKSRTKNDIWKFSSSLDTFIFLAYMGHSWEKQIPEDYQGAELLLVQKN